MPGPFLNVEVSVFLFSLSFGIFTPAQQEFIYRSICIYKYADKRDGICPKIDKSQQFSQQESAVQAEYASFSTFSYICLIPAAMFTTVIFGAWCDRFSHRIPLACPHIGSFLLSATYLIYYYTPNANETIDPIYLSAASFFAGISGYAFTQLAAASSYVSLSSDGKQRTQRLGTIHGFTVLGKTVGFIANALFFSNKQSYILGFVVQMAINCYAIVSVFVFVPEIRTFEQVRAEKRRQGVSWCQFLCRPLQIFLSTVKVVFAKSPKRIYRLVTMMSLAISAALVASISFQAVTYDFLTLQPISMTPFYYSIFQTVFTGATAVAYFGIIRIFRSNCCFGLLPMSDAAIAIMALASRAVSSIILAFGEFYPTVAPWLYAAVNICAPLCFITLRSGVSKLYDGPQQGRVFAMIGLLDNAFVLFASFAYNAIYSVLVSGNPSTGTTADYIVHGYIFLMDAVLTAIPILLITWLGFQPLADWSFKKSEKNINLSDK